MAEPLFLLGLGIVAALDATSAGQFLLSRPLIAGVLAGAILGDPGAALPVALVMEMHQVASVPAGGTRFPEGGVAVIPGVALAIWAGGTNGLLLGLAMAFFWAEVGGRTIVWLRRANGRRMNRVEAGVVPLSRAGGVHLTCLAWDGVRGGGVTGTGLLLAWALAAQVTHGGTVGGLEAGVVLLLLLPALAVCLVMLQPGRRRLGYLLVGLASGLVGGWVL